MDASSDPAPELKAPQPYSALTSVDEYIAASGYSNLLRTTRVMQPTFFLGADRNIVVPSTLTPIPIQACRRSGRIYGLSIAADCFGILTGTCFVCSGVTVLNPMPLTVTSPS